MKAVSLICCVGFLMALGWIQPALAAEPVTEPDPAKDRLTFLMLQLSSVETSIGEVNTALKTAGYKAAVAVEKAEGFEKGNEIMDRKGGAPVPWDQFYGKTAKDFIAPSPPPGTEFTLKSKGDLANPFNDPVRRPAQMDYIYRANRDQAAKAKAEVAALGKKTDALLARRKQLESEQSSLWATISWESIAGREASFRPLYRFKLKAQTKEGLKPGPTARVEILRASVLFLRTVDKAVADGLESVAEKQQETLKDLNEGVRSAEAALKQSLADAMLAADLEAEDLRSAKEMLALAKRMGVMCKNVTDAYRLAMDGDAAQDEGRKLRFRAAMQESMLEFSGAYAALDDLVTKTAQAWSVVGEKGVASEDKLPGPRAAVEVKKIEAPVAVDGKPAVEKKVEGSKRVDLLKLVDPSKDAVAGAWAIKDGVLVSGSLASSRIEFPYTPPAEYDYRIVFVRDRGTGTTTQICLGAGRQFTLAIGGYGDKVFGFGRVDGRYADSNRTTKRANHWIVNGERYTAIVKVRKDGMEAYLNDKLITSCKTDYKDVEMIPTYKLNRTDTIGLDINNYAGRVESAEVVEISGEGTRLRAGGGL